MSHGDNWYVPPLPGGVITRTSVSPDANLTELHLIAAIQTLEDTLYWNRKRVKIVSPGQMKRIKEYATLNGCSEDEACTLLCIPYMYM